MEFNILNLAPQKALISTLKRCKRPIAILAGSPLSMPDKRDAKGVPGVSGVLKILKGLVNEHELQAELDDYINGSNDSESYQKGFEFVQSWVGQDLANKVIIDSVLKARKDDAKNDLPITELDSDDQGWYLPKGLMNLGDILVNPDSMFTGPILTTNFDPLLSVAIKKNGGTSFQTVLSSDGSISQNRQRDLNTKQIIHLHGYWCESDTLHSPLQISSNRPKLKSSLSKVLENHTLLVLGYGGWDDVFMESLKDIMLDEDSKVDVCWAFFESDKDIINKKYKKLLETVQPAIIRGRFRGYGGVECNDFLEKLNIDLCTTPKTSIASKTSATSKALTTPNIVLTDNHNDVDLILEESKPKHKKWNFSKSFEGHRHVRQVEQMQFIEALNNNNIVSIISDWGMGKEEFIRASLSESDTGLEFADTYFIDLSSASTKDHIYNAFREQTGQELQVFIADISKQKSIIILEGIGDSQSYSNCRGIHTELSEIISVLADFSHNLNFILCSRHAIKIGHYREIKLSALDEADVVEYIKHGLNEDLEDFGQKRIDIISRLSSGLPYRLDRILSELSVLTIEELLEYENELSIDEALSNGDIPSTLVDAVNTMENSNTEDSLRSFSLLKILSVLSYGESIKNIKRFNNDKPFFPKHFKELHELGLIETSNSENRYSKFSNLASIGDHETSKVHTVKPIVASLILSHMTQEEVKDIVFRLVDLSFGTEWKSGKPRLNSANNLFLKSRVNGGPGNPHILIQKLLRYSIESDLSNDIKASFNLGQYYCKKLNKESRYRDVITVATDLMVLARETSEIMDVAYLNFLLGSALRMMGQKDEAIDELEEACKSLDQFDKTEKSSLYLDLALTYEALNIQNKGIEAAKKVKEFTTPKSGIDFQADSIILNLDQNTDKDDLKALETAARKKDFLTVANNMLLTRTINMTNSSSKIEAYDCVINSSDDQYNRYRAISRKVIELRKFISSEIYLNASENRLLTSAYKYSFSQRVSGLFNIAHEANWALNESIGDKEALANLFRYSSLIWRLHGDLDSERKYARKLNAIELYKDGDHLTSSSLRYFVIRLKVLKDKTIIELN